MAAAAASTGSATPNSRRTVNRRRSAVTVTSNRRAGPMARRGLPPSVLAVASLKATAASARPPFVTPERCAATRRAPSCKPAAHRVAAGRKVTARSAAALIAWPVTPAPRRRAVAALMATPRPAPPWARSGSPSPVSRHAIPPRTSAAHANLEPGAASPHNPRSCRPVRARLKAGSRSSPANLAAVSTPKPATSVCRE